VRFETTRSLSRPCCGVLAQTSIPRWWRPVSVTVTFVLLPPGDLHQAAHQRQQGAGLAKPAGKRGRELDQKAAAIGCNPDAQQVLASETFTRTYARQNKLKYNY